MAEFLTMGFSFGAFADFFSMENITQALSDPTNWGIIFSLIILEGLLSADNALVLAAMVKGLPENQRKKALMYGIWGAYIFRFIAIGVGVWLVKLWWIKIVGGGYLVFLSVKFFWEQYQKSKAGDEEEGEEEEGIKKGDILFRLFGQFWGTVFLVELMDIAFSIDSVLAAFAVSDEVWVLLLGGIFGVLMMRGVAGVFLKLLEKVPELEAAAFVIIIIIGLKMILHAVAEHFMGYHNVMELFGVTENAETIENIVFFGTLIVVFVGTYLLHIVRAKKSA